MSITETSETPVVAPKKKRKAAKKRAAAVAAPKSVAGIYAGMTVKDCCTGCNERACVISGKPYCAHPRKGGLHVAEQQDSGALARRRSAEKTLGKQLLTVE